MVRRWKARRKFRAYEKAYRKSDSLPTGPAPIHVEELFDEFVSVFGGAKISDLLEDKGNLPLNADYFFSEHNVVAELKTIEGVFSGVEGLRQFRSLLNDLGYDDYESFRVMFHGNFVPDIVKAVQRRVRRALESRISKARKQLKASKALVGNDQTYQVILIAVDNPPIFGHRFMLNSLVKLMADNYSDKEPDAVIYFNPNTPKKLYSDGMEYAGWYPTYRAHEDTPDLCDFVNLLGNRWLTYYGEAIGEPNPILEVSTEEEVHEANKAFL